MSEQPGSEGTLWRFERPDQKLLQLKERVGSFVPGYEELLELGDTEYETVVHARRLTPLGSAIQVFENEAFFVTGGDQVRGFMKFYCTETTDGIGATPTSYFYELYCNAGPMFKFIGRRILQHFVDRSSPLDPRNETLSGLYGNVHTAMLHVTSCELRDDWRGHQRLPALVASVVRIRVNGGRTLVHPDNPFRVSSSPSDAQVQSWEERYDEELAVQLADRVSYVTFSTQPSPGASMHRARLRAYIGEVAHQLGTDERPVLVVDSDPQTGEQPIVT